MSRSSPPSAESAAPILCSFFPDRLVDFANFTAADVDFDFVAQRLARVPRFVGGTSETYSVAQHSVFVCDIVAEEHRPWALLHDAHEAFVSDITSPTKSAIAAIANRLAPRAGDVFRAALHTLAGSIDAAIRERAGLHDPSAATVAAIAEADAYALETETLAFQAMSPENLERIGIARRLRPCFRPFAWTADRAEAEFLRALRQYELI